MRSPPVVEWPPCVAVAVGVRCLSPAQIGRRHRSFGAGASEGTALGGRRGAPDTVVLTVLDGPSAAAQQHGTPAAHRHGGPGFRARGEGVGQLATVRTFGDVWPRTDVLDTRTPRTDLRNDRRDSRHTRTAVRAARHRAQQRVAPEEIVETFIHIEAYAGAARAFDGYQMAQQVFAGAAKPQ
jgi:4-carboxymuconolactone decarboxylase